MRNLEVTKGQHDHFVFLFFFETDRFSDLQSGTLSS